MGIDRGGGCLCKSSSLRGCGGSFQPAAAAGCSKRGESLGRLLKEGMQGDGAVEQVGEAQANGIVQGAIKNHVMYGFNAALAVGADALLPG